MIAACKDLASVPASYSNLSDTATVYAVNGAPIGAPIALYFYGGTTVSANASFTFDIAFDIAGPGQVTILPLRAIASALVSTHSVGLATVADTFGSVDAVPKGTSFRADTAVTVAPNQVVLVQVDESGGACASSSTGSTIYGKVVVRSINRDTGTMQIEFAVDPNCGFRSFASGVPTFEWRPPSRGP
jgi:hypothetical protein